MLENKTALITGATSGIGEKTAELLALNGATVVAVGRNASKGQELVGRLAGSGHSFVSADLSDKNEVQSLVDKVMEAVGDINVLVNSAGVALHGAVTETDDRIWDTTMAVNLNAVFYLCRAFIPKMVANGGGVIVNVASTWGLVGAENSAAYCASKGALVQLTRSMAIDHAKDNVASTRSARAPSILRCSQQSQLLLDFRSLMARLFGLLMQLIKSSRHQRILLMQSYFLAQIMLSIFTVSRFRLTEAQ